MKCPFCDSQHILKDGFDETSMDIWRCMACGETITQADLDDNDSGDEEGDFELFLHWLVKSGQWSVGI